MLTLLLCYLHRYEWIENVKNATGIEDLRTCLGQLEVSLVRTSVFPWFNRNPLLVKGAWVPVGGEVASALPNKKGEVQQLPEAMTIHEGEPFY